MNQYVAFGWIIWSCFDCISYIKKQVLLNGQTGKLAFDNNGDRLFSEYEIINIDRNEQPVRVGQYFYSKVISFSSFHFILAQFRIILIEKY